MTWCNPQVKIDRAKQLIGETVVVIVIPDAPQIYNPSKTPDMPNNSSNTITLNKFILHGQQYIPFFSSKSAYYDYLKAAGIIRSGNTISEIDRSLFIGMTDPKEKCILNIRSDSEMTFTGEELRQIFPDLPDIPR